MGRTLNTSALRESSSIETRVLAVCDVFDALLSERVYRDAWTLERSHRFGPTVRPPS